MKGCGFKYFKIDFVLVAEGKNFYNGKGPQGALRKSLQLIRESIGKDSYLISGSYSLEAGAGLLDAARIDSDIHNLWSHIKRSAKETNTRFWLNGRIWNNDPDFFIVRCPATTDEFHLNRPYQILPYDGESSWLAGKEAARPLDLFSEEEISSIWLGEEKDYYLLGIFNWQDKEKEIKIDLKPLGVRKVKKIKDVWGETELKLRDIERIRLLPHQTKMLKIEK